MPEPEPVPGFVPIETEDEGWLQGLEERNTLRGTLLPWYMTTNTENQFIIERVQTGVRIEKRILKVLKAMAEYHDMSLGDLLEGIVLHAFEGKTPFGKSSLAHIAEFKRIYGLDLDASASHRLIEKKRVKPSRPPKKAKK